MPPHLDPSSSFQTTRWTWVVQLREGAEEPERDRILAELCRAYWSPLYGFARRSGKSQQDAEDATQGFFHHVLKADLFTKAQQTRGKLRSFLLISFKNYLNNQHHKEITAKRGGWKETLSLDVMQAEARYQSEPQNIATPEELYNRRWARDFFIAVMDRLRVEYQGKGKGALFLVLQPVVFSDDKAAGQASQAAVLGVTEGNFRIMLTRFRKRYRDLFREAVADTLDNPSEAEIEQEIRELIRLGAS